MLKKIKWYINFIVHCYQMLKLKKDLEFFEEMPGGTGKIYNVNIRHIKLKVRRMAAKKELNKRIMIQSEMYNVLNNLEDPNFKEEITVLTMMLILWALQTGEHVEPVENKILDESET